MPRVAYASPYVPPEWLIAHGCEAVLVEPCPASIAAGAAMPGTCVLAAAVAEELAGCDSIDGAVLTTSCDAMRRAAELLGRRWGRPVLLMNVPSTWQSRAAFEMYVAELRRVGRFLVALGGRSPTDKELANAARDLAARRQEALLGRNKCSAAAVAAGLWPGGLTPGNLRRPEKDGVAIALVGSPLAGPARAALGLLEQAGGRVVLDATELGEINLPVTSAKDGGVSFESLAAVWFESIKFVGRRPNSGLYQYLAEELPRRGVRGVVLLRHGFCDLWAAEARRLRDWLGVPMLDVELSGPGEDGRVLGRLRAFVETLS